MKLASDLQHRNNLINFRIITESESLTLQHPRNVSLHICPAGELIISERGWRVLSRVKSSLVSRDTFYRLQESAHFGWVWLQTLLII